MFTKASFFKNLYVLFVKKKEETKKLRSFLEFCCLDILPRNFFNTLTITNFSNVSVLKKTLIGISVCYFPFYSVNKANGISYWNCVDVLNLHNKTPFLFICLKSKASIFKGHYAIITQT